MPDGTITGFSDPVWFPDGNTLMVVGYYPDFVDPSMGTLEVNLNGEIQPDRGLGIGGRGASHPTLDPSGDRLACFAYIHLWGTGLFVTHRGSTDLPTLLAGDAREPAWSPDGSWIAFCSDRGDATFRVWVIAATGGTPVQVTEGRSPAWSPDGQSIAFARGAYFSSSQAWIATDLPDWRLPVAPLSWSQVKDKYRR